MKRRKLKEILTFFIFRRWWGQRRGEGGKAETRPRILRGSKGIPATPKVKGWKNRAALTFGSN
jgi:hypothetical protein